MTPDTMRNRSKIHLLHWEMDAGNGRWVVVRGVIQGPDNVSTDEWWDELAAILKARGCYLIPAEDSLTVTLESSQTHTD